MSSSRIMHTLCTSQKCSIFIVLPASHFTLMISLSWLWKKFTKRPVFEAMQRSDGRIAIALFSLRFEKLSRKEVNNDIWEKWLIMKFPSWQQNDEATYFIQKSLSTSSLFDLMQFSISFCAVDVCENWKMN